MSLRPVRGYGAASGQATSRAKLPPTAAWRPEPKPRCPKCGAYLTLRSGRHGKFYGCAEYPRCDVTLSLPVVKEAIRRHLLGTVSASK